MKKKMNDSGNSVAVCKELEKKKYVSPQIEVVELNQHAPLLSASANPAGSYDSDFEDLNRNDW